MYYQTDFQACSSQTNNKTRSIVKGKKTSRKRYSFHLKTSCGRSEKVLSDFRFFFYCIMPASRLEPSSGQQRVGIHLLWNFRGSGQVVWTLITQPLLQGLRQVESPTRHRFLFWPPCCPTCTVCRGRPLPPYASKEMLLTSSSNSLYSPY